jgi:hypothetical protein
MSERFDKMIERGDGQRSMDPAISLSQIRVVIFPTQR